jgi:hypothetical protein
MRRACWLNLPKDLLDISDFPFIYGTDLNLKGITMEGPEVPTEHLHEHINEHAHGAKVRWVMGVALTSALLAALAAVSALMAGHHVNEAMIDQIRSSDQWNFYQAKGVKASVLGSKLELLQGLGKEVKEKDTEKLDQYKKDQEGIKEKAEEMEKSSEHHLKTHVVFAAAVTMYQVAIAVGAISVLTNKRKFWTVSLGFGALGLVAMIVAILVSARIIAPFF